MNQVRQPLLTDAWYIAAESKELQTKPLARSLLDQPLVLFRDASGQAHALFDRCPHRNVQLSGGRLRQGQLQCPYHGWEFDGSGSCVHIPALSAEETIPKGACTRVYPLQEQQGLLWVWMGERAHEAHEQPFYLPYFDVNGWGWGRLQSQIANHVDNVIENFIDNPHTGYIHGGLFRTPASHWSESEVTTLTDGVSIDIQEENTENSFLSRLLVKGEVLHQDRFIYPSIVQVAYGFGPGRQIIGYQICTPVNEALTRIYVHLNWQMGWLNPLVAAGFPWVGRLVLHQDLQILENQGAMLARFGESFVSTQADTANLWIKATRQRLSRRQQVRKHKRRVRFRV